MQASRDNESKMYSLYNGDFCIKCCITCCIRSCCIAATRGGRLFPHTKYDLLLGLTTALLSGRLVPGTV